VIPVNEMPVSRALFVPVLAMFHPITHVLEGLLELMIVASVGEPGEDPFTAVFGV
jgi:hypothetical protein